MIQMKRGENCVIWGDRITKGRENQVTRGRGRIQIFGYKAVSLNRCGAGIIEWTKLELQEMDRKTRKLPTTYHSMHPNIDQVRYRSTRLEASGR